MDQKIMPPTYFIILFLLAIVSHFVFPVKGIVHAPYTYSGIILIIFGLIMPVWADSLFKKSGTTIKPNEIPTSLVTTGPYRITRQPIYSGMTAILLGEAIFLGSLITFIFPVIFAILMDVIFIPVEEKNLEIAFGEKYLDYKKKVRRWI
ncbi:Phospholipid methyltransferase [uncultured archaeon]|nr:Phospholipid methyltransferase [uncultured archaeon]